MNQDLEKHPENHSVSITENVETLSIENDVKQPIVVNEKEVAKRALADEVSQKTPEIDPNYVAYGYKKGAALYILFCLLLGVIDTYFQYDFEKRKTMWHGVRALLKEDSEDKSILIGVLLELIKKSKETVRQKIFASVAYAHLVVFLSFFAVRIFKHHRQVLKIESNSYSGCAIALSIYCTYVTVVMTLTSASGANGVLKDVNEASQILTNLVEQAPIV